MSTTCTGTAGAATAPARGCGQRGLALRIPARLLDQEFGRGRVVRFEEIDFPAALTHEPTRRFLRETGLPEDGILFELDTDAPLRPLTEYYADEYGECGSYDEHGEYDDADRITALPAHADRLIRLGQVSEDDSLVVDGTTGEVGTWSASDAALHPFDEDVSTLTHSLWLLHRTLSGRT
jgi:hypothetical protein